MSGASMQAASWEIGRRCAPIVHRVCAGSCALVSPLAHRAAAHLPAERAHQADGSRCCCAMCGGNRYSGSARLTLLLAAVARPSAPLLCAPAVAIQTVRARNSNAQITADTSKEQLRATTTKKARATKKIAAKLKTTTAPMANRLWMKAGLG